MNIPGLIINQVMQGMNPVDVLRRSGVSSPQLTAAINILNGKTPQQMQAIAENMCRELGTTPQEVVRSLGLIK